MRKVLPASEILNPAQLSAVRGRSNVIGSALVAHAWLVIGITAAMVAAFPNPATIALGILIIGSRQLGLVILMHDAAHHGLAKSDRLNHFLGQWLCAWPMLADVEIYRRYHLQHHTRTLDESDPDIVLTGHYPISRASLKRKLIRDISGQTGYAQRKFQIVNALRGKDDHDGGRLAHFWNELGPATVANVLLALTCIVSGYWWLYLTCWILPLLTWYQVVLRVRNIAEHAVLMNPNDPFGLARTTHANWLERIFIAPYWVNFHCEHHMVFWAPCYRLPLLRRFLLENGYGPRMQSADGYLSVLRDVTRDDIDESVSGGRRAIGSFGQGYK